MKQRHQLAAQKWERRRSALIAQRRTAQFRTPLWAKLTKLAAFANRHAEYH